MRDDDTITGGLYHMLKRGILMEDLDEEEERR